MGRVAASEDSFANFTSFRLFLLLFLPPFSFFWKRVKTGSNVKSDDGKKRETIFFLFIFNSCVYSCLVTVRERGDDKDVKKWKTYTRWNSKEIRNNSISRVEYLCFRTFFLLPTSSVRGLLISFILLLLLLVVAAPCCFFLAVREQPTLERRFNYRGWRRGWKLNENGRRSIKEGLSKNFLLRGWSSSFE